MSTVALQERRVTWSRDDVLARARAVLTGAAVACAALAALVYAYVALRRLGHPFELEWIEGGSLQEVRRVLHGQPVYTRPTVGWTPNIYPPLYYWLSAAVSHVVGLGFPALRGVSIAASIALGASVFFLVRGDTGELVGPTVAIGLVYASYRIGGAWYDIARVDSLFVGLLFVGLLLARRAHRPSDAALAGIVMVLAVLTKQSAIVPALAVVPWLYVVGRRVAIAFVAAFGIASAAVLGYLQLSTHGWFSYYMFTVPGGHDIETGKIIGFFTADLLGRVAPALVVAGFGVFSIWRDRPARVAWFYVPVFGALMFTAYSARLHTGGWDNVLLPAYVGIAVMAGIGVGRTRHSTPTARACFVLGLTVVQFLALVYAPWKQIPPSSDRAAGNELIAELRDLPEPVLLTGQSWLLVRAGHADQTTGHASAIQDVLRARAGDPARRLGTELEGLIRNHHYCSVVVERPEVFTSLPPDFEQYYKLSRILLRGNQLRPVTGLPIEPWELWVPRGGVPCT